MDQFIVGQVLEIRTTFSTKEGLYSPYAVRFKIKTPRGERLVYTSPSNPSTGVYAQLQALSWAGGWAYRTEALNAIGEVVAADQASFTVEAAAV